MNQMHSWTGKRFGRLVVLSCKRMLSGGQARTFCECLCDCGVISTKKASDLQCGDTKSCGCLLKEISGKLNLKHGKGHSRIWYTHQRIMSRCYYKKNIGYKDYGGRGIKVCDRWHVFENFYEDMGDAPEGFSLGRIDNNGDYSLNNCRWETDDQQSNNRRSNLRIEYNSEVKTLMQWSKKLHLSYNALRRRLNYLNWSVKEAFETPLRGKP